MNHQLRAQLKKTGHGLLILILALVLGCTDDDTASLVELGPSELRAAVELHGDSMPSLVPPLTSELSFDVTLPVNPRLKLSHAVVSTRRVPRARVDFRVRVLSDEIPATVYRRVLKVEDHNQWHHARVNLAAWAGKSVTILLESLPAPGIGAVPPWADRVQTVWGAPEISRGSANTPSERQSAIVVVVDTLRHDYLGVHGFEGDVSPNLDWLALESTRFDLAFAPAPWTKPSVATLLTGLYPQTHAVLDQGGKIDPRATDTLSAQAQTLADTFRANGYETAAFVGNSWLSPPYGFDQGFGTYIVDGKDPALIDKARKWLAERDPDTPYFLYLHLINVHGPYVAPELDYLAVRDSPSLGEDRDLSESSLGRVPYLDATPWANDTDRESLRAWRAKYAATVRQLDRRLGEFVSELRESGELDRAWLLFTSDHGEEFLEHGIWTHGYVLCNHQLHVPLWIREPNARSAGRRISHVTNLADVMPTLLASLSLPIPPEVQGTDRSEWLHEPPRGSSRTVAIGTGVIGNPELSSVRTDRYHLLWDRASDAVHLFDTVADPEELVDVAAVEPEVTRTLRQLLQTKLAEIETARKLESETVPVPEDLRQQLRGLGYIP